jgi:glyoxylate reductase
MSELPRVYLTRRLPQPALDLLARHVQLTTWPGELPPPRAVLAKEVADIDGLLTLPSDRVDRALIEAAPHLPSAATTSTWRLPPGAACWWLTPPTY